MKSFKLMTRAACVAVQTIVQIALAAFHPDERIQPGKTLVRTVCLAFD
ncbi:MAG TPA: hypothetical protein VFL47_11325 [Flavisolibacter sp.]|nr:hypothetical protein [Flavisolibacter sp.]